MYEKRKLLVFPSIPRVLTDAHYSRGKSHTLRYQMTSCSNKEGESTTGSDNGASEPRFGIRHVQVAVMALAAFMAYNLRYNLSVAIVAMVDTGNDTNTAISDIPVYDWSERIQGYVLSAFFWGYLMSQIPAGILSEKFGGHRFLCAGSLATSVLTLLFPICVTKGGWKLACVNRMLQGISQGFVFPSIYTLLGVWAPPTERSRLTSISLSAQLLGTVVSTPMSGYISCEFGWPSVFYISGAVGAAFTLIMIFLGADAPSKHRLISNAEKKYIESSLGGAKEEVRVPWKKVWTSAPYLSALCAYAFQEGVFSTFQTKTPTFLGTVLKFPIEDNGVLSALPSLVAWLLTYLFSGICDLLIGRGLLSMTNSRKLFNSIAYFGAALFIVLLAHEEGRVMSVIFLTLSIGIQSGTYVGVEATFVDLAPNFSGAIFSVANFMAACLGVCGPNVIGYIVSEKGSPEQWHIFFYLCAVLLVLSNVLYLIYATSKTQWWNWPDRYNNKEQYEEKCDKVEGKVGC